MKHQKNNWTERHAAYPVNEQQASSWNQNIGEMTAPKVQQSFQTVSAAAAGTAVNPWIENLPKVTPRQRQQHKGLWIFVLFLVLLFGSVGVYWAVFGLPEDRTQTFGGLHNISVLHEKVTIPITEGTDARITIQAEHGAVLTAKEVFQKVNPAVVAVLGDYGDGSMSVGTGVIFTEDGFFLTNAHVIQGSKECRIVLPEGKSYEAHLVGYDTKRDVAVLKAVDAKDLSVAEFGDSDKVEVGDWVYAIGNPLGMELRGTLTDGIISAVDRDVDVDGYTMELIQTNAAINEGNSGGPLINEYGQVIGLNTIKMSAGVGEVVIEGLGFAIPSRTVQRLGNQIMECGETIPDTAIGITVAPLTENEEELKGLLVHSVQEGSCAEEAGIRMGDVVLEADGYPTHTNEDLLEVRRAHAPGDEMTLKILRGTDEMEIVLTLDAAE